MNQVSIKPGAVQSGTVYKSSLVGLSVQLTARLGAASKRVPRVVGSYPCGCAMR